MCRERERELEPEPKLCTMGAGVENKEFWLRNNASVADRVNTRVSFVQNSREFHAKRVSYFAKICSLFREISCFAKLALKIEKGTHRE